MRQRGYGDIMLSRGSWNDMILKDPRPFGPIGGA
jgi:hypothetical protein